MARTRNYQTKKRWLISPEVDYTKVEGFSEAFLKLLAGRGVRGAEAIKGFLHPKFTELSDPFSIPDMDRAVSAVEDAIRNGHKVAIYGDYDVDGVTATALLTKFFAEIGVTVRPYIPSRENEGYGLNNEAIKLLADEGIKLIITVDCGSTSISEVEYANSLGLTVVVTDHHTLRVDNGETVLPPAMAVVNPKRMGVGSPLYELAGVAVAFYLARATMTAFTEKMSSGQEKWLLDLVALGTICDIVPLTGENRILANYGLVVLSKSKRPGIRALAEISEFPLADIDSYKVGFLLGPRLNAAGRIEHASAALELLTTTSKERAAELAHELNELNLERQELTERIVLEAKEMIEAGDKQSIYLLAHETWPAGVVGIVASRLMEEYGRPMLVMEENSDGYKGSARSVAELNIVEALAEAGEYLDHFGGHAFAAGFSLAEDKFILLRDKLIQIADGRITEKEYVPEIKIDLRITLADITTEFLEELALLEPLGRDNHKPVFQIDKVKIADYRLVGNPAIHLKLGLIQSGSTAQGIAFGYGETADVDENTDYDMVVNLELNEWNGRKKPEFRLIDLEKSDEN